MTRQKHKIDATNRTLGRLATEIATLLRGRHKKEFTYHQDIGDEVEVINPQNIVVTGNKLKSKIYYRHSGYPGGIKSKTLEQMIATKPEQVIIKAVRNMLPDNRLRQSFLKRLTFTKEND